MQLKNIKTMIATCAVSMGIGVAIAEPSAGDADTIAVYKVGDATLKQLSAGFQAGGKAYSEVVFFEDKRALDEFESGKFEFSAGASAIATTAAAGATVGTNGVQANASGTENNATSVGQYNKGMAVFTIAKGGLMYAAAIAGQKFSFKPRGTKSDKSGADD